MARRSRHPGRSETRPGRDPVNGEPPAGPAPLEGRRLLVVRPGALGDTILALPAIRALRRAVGRSGRVELVGYPAPARLAVNALHADAAHSIDRACFATLFSPPASDELHAFLSGFDLLLLWCRDPRGEIRAGVERAGLRCLQAPPYPDPASRRHAAAHLLETLAPLGIDSEELLPRLLVPPDAEAEARHHLRRLGVAPPERELLVLHPGSGSPEKNWPAPRWAALAEEARAAGYAVLLVEGPADRRAVSALEAELSFRPEAARGWDLEVLAAVLRRSRAFIGNDSGVTHLAAAAGAPTVALFSRTDPAVWRPLGRRVAVLDQKNVPGAVWVRVLELARAGKTPRPEPPPRRKRP